MPEGNVEDNPNAGIWQQILSESTTAEGVSIDGRSVVVLGERNCGKTSLLSKFKNKDLHKDAKGLAIDYTYLEVKEDEDVLTRINVWQLEGEREHDSLLKFALNAENIHKSVILITLDFSKPWDLAHDLESWLETLTNHIKSLRLTSKVLEPLRNKLIKQYHEYTEPETGAKKKKRVIDLTASSTDVETDDEIPSIDDENALTQNLGVPIVVACCKTDIVSTLERNFHFRDDEFEFIQQHLRKTCLKYGATLIYTSTRENYNCDVLLEYLEHLLFDFDFVYQTQVLAKEALFVPCGWDSTEKINVDFRNQQLSSDPEQPYEEVIKKPSSVLQQETIKPLVVPEDDQAFLERHKNALDKQEHVKKIKDVRDSSLQSPASITTTPTADAQQKEALRQNFLEQMKKASPAPSSPATPTPSPAKNSPSINRDEMKSFFNNLLKKDAKS